MQSTVTSPTRKGNNPPAGEISGTRKLRYRPDIQGLRAVAVMLVVADHLKIPGFKGGFLGVDVFFVISGFLITSLLAAEFERNRTKDSPGGISIKAFYVRRARRILPAGMLVIAAVLIAATLEFNVFRFEEVQSNAFWATLFLSNFDLMSQATDYFAQTNSASPLQNYWSLAVEEQFYIVWPLIFMLAARVGWSRRASKTHDWGRQATIAILVITVLSLVWSVIATNANPSSAYFSPFTRAYELGIGATIAVLTPQIRALLTPNTSRALGLIGLGLLGVGLAVLTSSTPYPGLWALIPTLGAGALIAAGLASDDHNPAGTALSIAPAGFLGKISYSIYLWHWPIIVFAASMYPGLKGAGRVGVLLPLIIAVSWATYVLVEQPYRTFGKGSGTPRGFIGWIKTQGRNQTIKAGAMALLAAATLLVIVTWSRPAPSAGETRPLAGSNVDKWAHWDPTASTAVPGADVQPEAAASDTGAAKNANEGPTPARIKAIRQGLAAKKLAPATLAEISQFRGLKASNVGLACFQESGAPEARCSIKGTSSSGVAQLSGKKVVLLGDSYASQWSDGIQAVLPPATTLTSVAGWECKPFDLNGVITQKTSGGHNCKAHNRWSLDQVKRIKPDLVIVSTASFDAKKINSAQAVSAFVSRIKKAGARVMWIGAAPETPNWDTCLGKSNEITRCSATNFNSGVLSPLVKAGVVSQGEHFWDVERLFCVAAGCPGVISDVPIRWDGSHLTKKAVQGVLPQLKAAIENSLATPGSTDGPGPSRIKAIQAGLAVKKASPQELQAIRGVAADHPEWLKCSQTQGAPAAACSRSGSASGPKLETGKVKSAMLVGNSYAAQWAGAMVKALPAGAKLTSLAENGCVPFDIHGAVRARSKNGSDCGKHAMWSLAQIKKAKPSLVVVSTDQWPPSTKFSTYAAVREWMRRIQTSGAKVLWIGTVPRALNWDRCLKGSNDIASCSTNDKAGSRLDPGALSAVQASGATFWDPEPLFCVQRGCPALINGRPVRLDGSHFTKTALDGVLTQLTGAISAAMNQQSKSK